MAASTTATTERHSLAAAAFEALLRPHDETTDKRSDALQGAPRGQPLYDSYHTTRPHMQFFKPLYGNSVCTIEVTSQALSFPRRDVVQSRQARGASRTWEREEGEVEGGG